jgi:hypothetical protein
VSDVCTACKKVVLRQGNDGATLKRGTYGHIQSAACRATKETVTAAHNKCFNKLIRAIIQHRKKKSIIEFVNEDKHESFKTIWGKSALRQLCTAERVE